MGRDPEAIIYYGFPVGEVEDSIFDVGQQWEEERRPPKPDGDLDRHGPEWEDWRKRYWEWRNSPEYVSLKWSGAEDCECNYLSAPGLTVSVEWDEQEDIANRDFGPRPEADKYMKEFCEQFGIEFKKPSWHLAARYF